MAGLMELLKHAKLAALLELDASARVLVFGTEEGSGEPQASA
jgi:hypothetical protein